MPWGVEYPFCRDGEEPLLPVGEESDAPPAGILIEPAPRPLLGVHLEIGLDPFCTITQSTSVVEDGNLDEEQEIEVVVG